MNEGLRITVARLTRMRDKIRQHANASLVATKSRAINATTSDDEAFWAEMTIFERELRTTLRDLAGDLKALEHEYSLTWRIPRDLRFSARQSVSARQQNVLDVVELAELVLRELLDAGGSAAKLRAEDWKAIADEAGKLIDRAEQALLQQAVVQVQKGPAFTAANGQPGLTPGHLGPVVAMLIALIGHYVARYRRKR
jgi:hypothetical protein